MRHVNTGFYYGLNTLSSVSYHTKIKTSGGERKRNRVKIDSKKMSQVDSEMVVCVGCPLWVSFSSFIQYILIWQKSTNVFLSFVFVSLFRSYSNRTNTEVEKVQSVCQKMWDQDKIR